MSVVQESMWNPEDTIMVENEPGIGIVKFPELVLSVLDVVTPELEAEKVKETLRG